MGLVGAGLAARRFLLAVWTAGLLHPGGRGGQFRGTTVGVVAENTSARALEGGTDLGRRAHSGQHGGAALWGRDACLLYTSPSPRDRSLSRMPSSA